MNNTAKTAARIAGAGLLMGAALFLIIAAFIMVERYFSTHVPIERRTEHQLGSDAACIDEDHGVIQCASGGKRYWCVVATDRSRVACAESPPR